MKRKIPAVLLCVFFCGIACIFGIRLCRAWSEYRTGEQVYEELSQYMHPATSHAPETKPAAPAPAAVADVPVTEPAPDTETWPTVDFEALQAVNPDVVAWIFIEGTNINYPVVQGSDNRYYLNRLFDRSYNGAGTIFMDYRNRSDLSGRNTVFYGHHMKNGTMFNQITEYKDQVFYDKHPVCLVMTPGGNYRLEFFAGYVTDMNSQAWKLEFASDEEYTRWLEDAIRESTFVSSVKPTARDRVVTFSTCTYEYDDARYVLVGVLQ